MRGFGKSSVSGRRRVPRPAAKTKAWVMSVISRKMRDSSTSSGMTRKADTNEWRVQQREQKLGDCVHRTTDSGKAEENCLTRDYLKRVEFPATLSRAICSQ